MTELQLSVTAAPLTTCCCFDAHIAHTPRCAPCLVQLSNSNTRTALTLHSFLLLISNSSTLTPKIKCTAAETEIKTQTQLNFSLHSLRNCKHKLCKSKQPFGFDSLTVWLTPAWMCQSNGRTARISVCGGATSILTQSDLSRAQIVAVNNRSDICSDKYEQMKDSCWPVAQLNVLGWDKERDEELYI